MHILRLEFQEYRYNVEISTQGLIKSLCKGFHFISRARKLSFIFFGRERKIGNLKFFTNKISCTFVHSSLRSVEIYIGDALTSVDKTGSWLSAYRNFRILKDNQRKGGLDVE